MSINVRVRIVGVYWSSEVTIEDGQSVWDATKAAEASSGGRLIVTGSGTIFEAIHRVGAPIVDTPTIPPRPPRPQGTYRIFAERKDRKQASVWQYYLNRKVKLEDGSEVFTTISIDNRAVPATSQLLKDGDFIVWRLLKIALEPESPDQVLLG